MKGQITNFKLQISNYKLLIDNLQSVICNLKFLPCACLLDSVKDTPLFTNWLMLFVGGLFFLGAAVALFLAWRGGHMDFKGIEDVKYKVLEDGERQ